MLAAATLPSLTMPPPGSQQDQRITWMAFRLHELELDHTSILCLCHLTDWPWLRAAYQANAPYDRPEATTGRPVRCSVNRDSLYFALGELPFLTELYERRRETLHSDWNLAIDGVKELLIETRARWIEHHRAEGASIPDWVTPQILQVLLQYVRNLTLLERRLTPSLYSLIVAAKQTAGDDFAVMLLKTARSYGYQEDHDQSRLDAITVGLNEVELPDGTVASATNRLQGPPLVWRELSLKPKPDRKTSRRWSHLWNPQRQCSWPPEDQRIESFNTHVRAQASALIGADLAKTEKFTTSMKDGLDLRESLRRWLGGKRSAGSPSGSALSSLPRMDLYVREIPPARGNVEVVIFLFDTPADPLTYSWQATWFAEHQEESTLCFYATPFADDMVGTRHCPVALWRRLLSVSTPSHSGYLERSPPRLCDNPGGAADCGGSRSHPGNPHCARDTRSAPRQLAENCQAIWKDPRSDSALEILEPDARPAPSLSRAQRP